MVRDFIKGGSWMTRVYSVGEAHSKTLVKASSSMSLVFGDGLQGPYPGHHMEIKRWRMMTGAGGFSSSELKARRGLSSLSETDW